MPDTETRGKTLTASPLLPLFLSAFCRFRLPFADPVTGLKTHYGKKHSKGCNHQDEAERQDVLCEP